MRRGTYAPALHNYTQSKCRRCGGGAFATAAGRAVAPRRAVATAPVGALVRKCPSGSSTTGSALQGKPRSQSDGSRARYISAN